MATIFQGGSIVNGDGIFSGDLKVAHGKITAMGALRPAPEDEVLDVTGRYLFPGMVDVHTHLDLDTGSTKTADDFPSGTKAAIAGGTTTIIDFATQAKGQSLKAGLRAWQEKAALGAYCDYGFHMAVVDWNPMVCEEMQEMAELGVTSFKMYMAYKDSLQVADGVIYQALCRSKELGGLIGFHCENGDLVKVLQEELIAQGKTGPYYHPRSRPDLVEEEAIFRLGEIAALAKAPVWVVHLSTEKGLSAIRKLRSRGVRVLAETCPQYLLLEDSRYGTRWDTEFEGAKYVISPPLRKSADRQALWRGLQNQEIDWISTDHCSFNYHGQKELGRGDFTKIPNGASGLEHRFLLLYQHGVCENRLSLTQLAALLAQNPAQQFGLTQKGVLAPGKDGDILVFDPRPRGVITAEAQVQRADYTPYEGMAVRGRVERVFLRGREVYCQGTFPEEGRPSGVFVKRGPSFAH